jgi:hypothetical protein
MFNNMGRIGFDYTDNTQKNMYNTRMANHTLSNFFNDAVSDSHVKFATMQPSVSFNSVNGGSGVGGGVVDFESILKLNVEQERPLEKVQLFPRPFLTIPYLGKGHCDPLLEAQLLQGENSHDKKSVSTIMTKSFAEYAMYPVDSEMQNRVNDTRNTIEESALDGWVRGGVQTRELAQDGAFAKDARPNMRF